MCDLVVKIHHCRDLADFGMGFNAGPPLMSREEFEARKADLKRKREIERRGER
jgi:E3 ubiquitin-protein ligase RBBP6